MIALSTLTDTARKAVGTAFIIGVAVVDKAEETLGIHPTKPLRRGPEAPPPTDAPTDAPTR
jgi:hypothetical protein